MRNTIVLEKDWTFYKIHRVKAGSGDAPAHLERG